MMPTCQIFVKKMIAFKFVKGFKDEKKFRKIEVSHDSHDSFNLIM